MKFTADLHIHSRYSRATAKNLDLEHIYQAAQIKGVHVVGTGDFTFPAWREELEKKLEPAEPGLFSLKKEIADQMDKTVPESCRHPVRFILQTEISNIYKKDGRVRKNHNLVYFPDMDSVAAFNKKLDAIGNITSDGRPILGLDAADLLSIMLEVNDAAMFIPAHIWTPWFSLFGSKSGFDSVAECFGELKSHIFAVETGLSSDPPMNWRVSDLDGMSLISCSDAHSPGYIGRNATVFDTQLSFDHIRQALMQGDPETCLGTLDMFPHQGKYHYDGHRSCHVCLNPSRTLELEGICPECGKLLTCGVLYRVQQLASRPEGYLPGNRPGYQHIVPLADILSEIFEVGPKTKKVAAYYQQAVNLLGPELQILLDRSDDEIQAAKIPMLAHAISKMRQSDIQIDPGYDGAFGKVNIFSDAERKVLKGETYALFQQPKPESTLRKRQKPAKDSSGNPVRMIHPVCHQPPAETDLLTSLNDAQQKAVESTARRIIIQAGPGTGKTRTLTARIARLIATDQVKPEAVLALTFTNKAAKQLEQQIQACVSHQKQGVLAATFHGFCLKVLKQYSAFDGVIADDFQRRWLIRQALGSDAPNSRLKKADHYISFCRQRLLSWEEDLSAVVPAEDIHWFQQVYQSYDQACSALNMADFEELVFRVVRLLADDAAVCSALCKTYQYVFIDEYQDLNFAQYALVQALCKDNHILVIGDPDQSIYGFRGSDNIYFKQFETDFPGCVHVKLVKNYRSGQIILDAAFQMITRMDANSNKARIISQTRESRKVIIKESRSETSEAVGIGKMIEALVGGTSFLSMDTRKMNADGQKEYAFSDIAVLYRTARQGDVLKDQLQAAGIPVQRADKKRILETGGIRQLVHICRILVQKTAVSELDAMDMAMLSDLFDTRLTMNLHMENLFEQYQKLQNQADGADGCQKILNAVCQLPGICDQMEKSDPVRSDFEQVLAIARMDDTLKAFLDRLALNQDVDTIGFQTQKVSLMTIHAAKGLEFPVVFVAGCEQGLIPYCRPGQAGNDIEEERRLFYVAMTRAMEILCLTYAGKRRIFGKVETRQPSIFLDDIQKELVQVETAPPDRPIPKKPRQLELF